MRIIRVNFGKQNGVARILGVVGEDQATRIIVDCSVCMQDWPDAWFRILAKRGSEKAYIAADGLKPDKSGLIHYLVTNVETAHAGYVFFEVQAFTMEGLAKSWKFDTIVSESLGEPGEKPDPPAPAWYEDVKQAAEDAFASEESAKTRAAEAGSSAEAAEKAKEAADAARAKAEEASGQAVQVSDSLKGTVDAIENIRITAQTLNPDAYATAEAELTEESLEVRLGLPRGKEGAAAIFEIVNTVTLPSGEAAYVEETEDSTAQHRQFVLYVPEGKSGNDFVVLGIKETLDALNADHPVGEAGQAYAVGTPASNQVYVWDIDTSTWKNIGSLQGPAGQKGKDGKTAYESATEAGYTGTSASFYANLSEVGNKLNKTGDGADVTVTFTEATSKLAINSGETLKAMFGKIKKWFSGLGPAAWAKIGTGDGDVAAGKHASQHAAGGADPVTAADVGASNPNLLINGGFSVWQRGTSFAAPSNAYTADRWRANGTGTVTKAAGGLQVTGTVTLVYVMEDADYAAIAGKQVTLSKSINGVVTSQTFVASSATVVSLPLTNQTVNWVKLEIGKVATAFSARPYAEELAICQRYYQTPGNISLFAPYHASINNWYYRAASYYWCTMRVTPALLRASAYIVNVGAITDENLVIDMSERGISLINVKNVGAVPQSDNTLVMTDTRLDAEIY